MSNGTNSNKRRQMDFMKLASDPSRVLFPSDTVGEFWVEFHGPEGTPYEEGVWMLHTVLPEDYPFKSPSIGFTNRILHPNVDERSGSVCLDVINQTWTPLYELKNVFDVFLPQLLRYPNPSDPLNPVAARKLQTDPVEYAAEIQAHVARYATRERALSSIPPPYGPLSSNHEDDRSDDMNETEQSATVADAGASVEALKERNSQEIVDHTFDDGSECYVPDEIDI